MHGEVLHAAKVLRYFHVACYISIPGCLMRLKSIKRPEEGNVVLLITKKPTNFTEPRLQA